MENWQEILANPNYIVSDTGRCRRKGSENDHSTRMKKGYLVTDLYEHGKRKTERVHRLVAEAFVPNPDGKPEVNHKDGNRLNNRADNLEWCTKKENCHHAWNNGLAKPSRSMLGRKNPNGGRKGKPFKIIETGEVFDTLKDCEEAIGGNNRHINDCLRGRQRSHRGYHFEYL